MSILFYTWYYKDYLYILPDRTSPPEPIRVP